MSWVFIIVLFLIDLYVVIFEYNKNRKFKKLANLWKKVYKAYQDDDFATINKAVKKIKKIEDDPLIKLLEIEKYLYGKTVFQDKAKAMELLLEIDKIKLPAKTKFESSEHTKKLAEKRKSTKKKLKKEKYLKSIKKAARETWNNHEFWVLRHNLINQERLVE